MATVIKLESTSVTHPDGTTITLNTSAGVSVTTVRHPDGTTITTDGQDEGSQLARLTARFEAAGQGHVTDALAALPTGQYAAMAAELEQIDPVRVNTLFARAMAQTPAESGAFQPLTHMAELNCGKHAVWR
jgi:hypothetical protein